MATDILITRDNQKVSYRHYDNGRKRVIVIAHGFFNSKESILLNYLKDSLIDEYDVVMFDFRGHGKSSGLFSWMAKEELDLEAVLTYVKKRYERIGLIAFSLGASIGINFLSANDIVDSFIAISAPCEFEKIDYCFWKLDLENDILYNLGEGKVGKGVRPGPFWLKKAKPIDSVSRIKCPVLYIHGNKDWVVGCRHSEKLYTNTRSQKELKIIRGGSHAEYLLRRGSQEEVLGLIKEWFKKSIGGQ